MYVVALAAVAAALSASSLVVSRRFTDFEWGRKNVLAHWNT